MSTTSVTNGVCLACRYGLDCIYEAGAHGLILQCEQFELALPAPSVRATATKGLTAADPLATANGLAGLCSNCEFRDACIYPKPEGGVWRCEEYR